MYPSGKTCNPGAELGLSTRSAVATAHSRPLYSPYPSWTKSVNIKPKAFVSMFWGGFFAIASVMGTVFSVAQDSMCTIANHLYNACGFARNESPCFSFNPLNVWARLLKSSE